MTISGTAFGATQGSGTVLLGSTFGSVTSWSDTQIVADVSAIARSGMMEVQQGGLSSNQILFNVNTATVNSVAPTSGLPGTQVVIAGSGFGNTQGNGQVILGTASAQVLSWTDTQVISVMSAGSTSGKALIFQDGITSNSVPFTVNTLHLSAVSPNSGGPGTSVTITGTGFGWNQGNGIVWLGGASAQIVSWSDAQIVAVVASNAVSGVVRVEQLGILSNASSFTVPGASNPITLNPNTVGMFVGETKTLQALDANGQVVTGLSWTSSNPQVVSLSTDDPPVVTALAVGHVTVTAGDGSADVTVYAAGSTLGLGSVLWSNPGDGSGVANIVPAVPSPSGVADVFALNGDCNVQALTSNGTVAWSVNIGQPPEFSGNLDPCNQFLPDFQGGIVVKSEDRTQDPNGTYHYNYHIRKVDGATGQAYPQFNLQSKWWLNTNFWTFNVYNPWIATYSPMVVHPDGTIFTIDSSGQDLFGFPVGPSVVDVIDPTIGQARARIDHDSSGLFLSSVGNLIVAGDGYAYVPYTTGDYPYRQNVCGVVWKTYLRLLRIGTDGSTSFIPLDSWDQYSAADCSGTFVDVKATYLIANADQGVLVSWRAETGIQDLAGWHFNLGTLRR